MEVFEDTKRKGSGNLRSARKKCVSAVLCLALGVCALGGAAAQARLCEAASQTKMVKTAAAKQTSPCDGKISTGYSKNDAKTTCKKAGIKRTAADETREDAKKYDKNEISEHNGKDRDGKDEIEKGEDSTAEKNEIRGDADKHDKQEAEGKNGEYKKEKAVI